MSGTRASVIILAWNGREYLGPCLSAVLAQTRPADQVIVVDNASTDGSADLVAHDYPQVELIRNERNLGFSGGMNVGLRAATGDILVLLNQDTQVRPDWLENLVAAMVADPSIGVAGCKILYPDGMLQHGGAAIVNARGDTAHLGWHEPDHGQCDKPFDAETVTGAALGVTRATLGRIGPLDESFAPAYYEDTDWCYRARAAGYRVRYVPGAVLVHHESASSAHSAELTMYIFHRNRVRFVLKHSPAHKITGEFLPQEITWLNELGPGGERLVVSLRRAYLDNLLALGDLARWRKRLGVPGDMGDLAEALVRLREVCDTSRFSNKPEAPGDSPQPYHDKLLDKLHASWALKEQPFHSDVPLVGPAIAGARAAFNSISTRWYVLPLAQQQTEFNAGMTAMLTRLVESLNESTARHDRDVTELVQELSTLAERLLALERQVSESGQ